VDSGGAIVSSFQRTDNRKVKIAYQSNEHTKPSEMSSMNFFLGQDQETDGGNNESFWGDAILDLVNNGYYAETPSPGGANNLPNSNTNFTYDLQGPGSLDHYTMKAFFDQEKVFDATSTQKVMHDHGTLVTPRVAPPATLSSREKEISYLESMLMDSIDLPFHGHPLAPEDNTEQDNQVGSDVVPNSNLDLSLTAMLQNNEQSNTCFKVDEDDSEDTKPVVDNADMASTSTTNNVLDDQQLITMTVPELNKAIRNLPGDLKLQVKQRRRLLKNRGYAQKCRSRRIYSEKYYSEENSQLKQLLEVMTAERNLYKTKYENLKAIIKKAKGEREQRKLLELGTGSLTTT